MGPGEQGCSPGPNPLELGIVWNEDLTSARGKALKAMRPKVELFQAPQTIVDQIQLAQLEKPEFEFMKGIFMKAGIWEDRDRMFVAGQRTSRQLDEASKRLTACLRSEWEQGRDLEWKLEQAGGGETIRLYIKDPAVNETYVRPSQRSSGFTSFFILALTIFARTASNNPQGYIFLFDEPGTYLHPVAQVNLQRVFDSMATRSQIIYSTHSIFLVNKNYPSRNRVVKKTHQGTVIDRKPYTRNWKSVRDSLGIIFSHNFLIADRTLLVEGPSDEIYVLAVLRLVVRLGKRDYDLNDFSIYDAGNAQNHVIMSKIMLEEGRSVVLLADGDGHGKEVKSAAEKLASEHIKSGAFNVLLLPGGQSTEDILPHRELYFEAIRESAQLLVDSRIREWTPSVGINETVESLKTAFGATKGITLGKFVDDETKKWFKGGESISKLLIAERYDAKLEQLPTDKATVTKPLLAIVDEIAAAIGLQARRVEQLVFEPTT